MCPGGSRARRRIWGMCEFVLWLHNVEGHAFVCVGVGDCLHFLVCLSLSILLGDVVSIPMEPRCGVTFLSLSATHKDGNTFSLIPCLSTQTHTHAHTAKPSSRVRVSISLIAAGSLHHNAPFNAQDGEGEREWNEKAGGKREHSIFRLAPFRHSWSDLKTCTQVTVSTENGYRKEERKKTHL